MRVADLSSSPTMRPVLLAATVGTHKHYNHSSSPVVAASSPAASSTLGLASTHRQMQSDVRMLETRRASLEASIQQSMAELRSVTDALTTTRVRLAKCPKPSVTFATEAEQKVFKTSMGEDDVHARRTPSAVKHALKQAWALRQQERTVNCAKVPSMPDNSQGRMLLRQAYTPVVESVASCSLPALGTLSASYPPRAVSRPLCKPPGGIVRAGQLDTASCDPAAFPPRPERGFKSRRRPASQSVAW